MKLLAQEQRGAIWIDKTIKHAVAVAAGLQGTSEKEITEQAVLAHPAVQRAIEIIQSTTQPEPAAAS